jgi:hypothetical protein
MRVANLQRQISAAQAPMKDPVFGALQPHFLTRFLLVGRPAVPSLAVPGALIVRKRITGFRME